MVPVVRPWTRQRLETRFRPRLRYSSYRSRLLLHFLERSEEAPRTDGISRIHSRGAIDEARQNGQIVKCILVRDHQSKNVFAHAVPCKGNDEEGWVANTVADDCLWLGYKSMILKSDNEVALLSLVNHIVAAIQQRGLDGISVRQEHSAAYDSQSNGGTEVGVRNVRGLFRTLKLCLEERIQHHIDTNHPLVPWLHQHTCMLLNARVKREDGKTSWSRIRGRASNQKPIGLGESVQWKLPSNRPRQRTRQH